MHRTCEDCSNIGCEHRPNDIVCFSFEYNKEPNVFNISTKKETGIKHDNGKPPVGYESLQRELNEALNQASSGKGKERHADGEPFEKQKILVIARWLKGNPAAGLLQQAVKKILESSRLEPSSALRELAGAINYTAAGMIIIREEMEEKHGTSDI